MKSDETGEYSLGYICMGVPITIDQIHMVYLEGGKRQTSFRFDTEIVDEDHFQERVAEWIHELTEYVMQQKFDPVREAPLTGKDIEQMVMMPGKKNSHADVLNKLEKCKRFWSVEAYCPHHMGAEWSGGGSDVVWRF